MLRELSKSPKVYKVIKNLVSGCPVRAMDVISKRTGLAPTSFRRENQSKCFVFTVK